MTNLGPHLVRRAALLCAGAASTAALTGCQVMSGPQTAQVRFVDATPDLPGPGAVDVYRNADAVLYNIGFGTASSYMPLEPGRYSYAVNMAGAQQKLANVMGSFALGGQYTVLIANTTASMKMTVLRDQSTPAAAGRVALRFLHEATRTGAVDVYLLPSGARLTRISPVMANVSFGNAPMYLDVPSGTYSVVVFPAAVMPASGSLPIYTGSYAEYPGSSARTLVLIDQPSGQAREAGSELEVITASDYDSPTVGS